MSTEAQISISSEDGASGKPLERESVQVDPVVKGDSIPAPSPPYHVEQNASDSGVSNASSLTSDSAIPLNNGNDHSLATKSAFVYQVAGEDAAHPVGEVPRRSLSTPSKGESSRRSTEALNSQEHLTSLLEVSGATYGLSMMSLEVMTSGEQLNLIAEGLGESEGSVGSRSLSPDLEEGEGRSKDGDGDSVSVPVTTSETGERG